ncbi:MAG: helix-turn-helix transcriptional regulator, partial [Gammaproteobacteria bacterium]|nr:helix-turn-helix transcriptional regulator [Gammaproteobacteria bacterium]
LAVMRPPGAPPFNRADCDRLDAFAVHVRRALVLHERFAALDLERRGALQGLEDAPTALIVAGADARPLFANRAARRVLDAGDGVCIERECLRGHDASATQHLHAAITAAARAGLTGAAAPGANLLLLPCGGGESRAVNVLPLPSAAGAVPGGRRALALLVINDADLGEAAASRAWREAFGITAAQARVLAEVVRGADTTTIAARLGLGVSTVRTHLKALFRATGTRDQPALVRTAILARALPPDGTTPSPT